MGIEAIIPGIVSVATGLIGQSSAKEAQGKDFEHQKELQQRNFDQQTFLRNTQYQSAVADMQKAGLNPMLAYMQGGNQASGAGGAIGGSNAASAVASAWGNVGNYASALTNAVAQPASLTQLQVSQAKTQDTQQALNRTVADLNVKYGTQVDADVLFKKAQTYLTELQAQGVKAENAQRLVKAKVYTEFPDLQKWGLTGGEFLRNLLGGLFSGTYRTGN